MVPMLVDRITPEQLVDLTIRASQEAGSFGVVDPAKIIARSKVKTYVINGSKLDTQIRAVVSSNGFTGTIIGS